MSNFVVSARKYRPGRFDDVVGQQHVSITLKNALQNDQLAHAFLFTGPRGVGKTTCARILAKVLNCQNVTEDFEPCNTCSSCESFNSNASFNITELDAASNNSVEHIRSLIEQVRFQPQQGKYKIFIIDEVHMLSQQAFNAFLKTLEEPPSYAIFILATTEKHKIIPTILSRCQIFDFRRILVKDIVSHLEKICKEENISAEKEALHLIAQKADGALRDALSIFDRIASAVPKDNKGGKTIKYEQVTTQLNVLDYDYYFKVTDALMTSDVSQTLVYFDEILNKGFDPDIFINGLAEHLRNVLVCKDEKTLNLLEASDDLRKRYQNQATIAPASFLLTALNIANDCDINYKMARHKRLHTEMALIKMAHIAQAVSRPVENVFIPEKKNLEQTVVNPTPPIVQEEKPKVEKIVEPTPAAPPAENKIEAIAPLPIDNTSEPSVPEVVNETPEPTPMPATPTEAPPQDSTPASTSSFADKLKKGKKLGPSLSMNAIQQSVQEDTKKNQAAEDKVITLEEVQKYWKEYAESVSSKTVQLTITGAELRLKDKTITVITGSKRSEGHIRDEFELMHFLRTKLGIKDLLMDYEIDPSKSIVHNTPKKEQPLTTKEKFQKMKEQNPLVEDIYKRFDLKVDND